MNRPSRRQFLTNSALLPIGMHASALRPCMTVLATREDAELFATAEQMRRNRAAGRELAERVDRLARDDASREVIHAEVFQLVRDWHASMSRLVLLPSQTLGAVKAKASLAWQDVHTNADGSPPEDGPLLWSICLDLLRGGQP